MKSILTTTLLLIFLSCQSYQNTSLIELSNDDFKLKVKITNNTNQELPFNLDPPELLIESPSGEQFKLMVYETANISYLNHSLKVGESYLFEIDLNKEYGLICHDLLGKNQKIDLQNYSIIATKTFWKPRTNNYFHPKSNSIVFPDHFYIGNSGIIYKTEQKK